MKLLLQGWQWVEWDASSCEVWGVQRESESSVEANISEAEAQDCRVHIRPHLPTTTRQPGVKPTSGHRPEPTTSEQWLRYSRTTKTEQCACLTQPDPRIGLPRTPFLRTSVNTGKKRKGRGC